MIARTLRPRDRRSRNGPIVFEHACKLGLEGIVSSAAIPAIVPGARRTESSRRTPPARRCYDSPGMSMGDTLRSILTRLVAYVAVVIAAGPRRRAVDQAETGDGPPSTG